jgi:uncharacterized flavoprotein (TIGR03862 family)
MSQLVQLECRPFPDIPLLRPSAASATYGAMEETRALVIGGGPAGLMAAEALGQAGHRVLVTEGKPTLGRKLLMAGKSGLNLTKEEPREVFDAAYTDGADWLAPFLADLGPRELRAWADGLGAECFTGSSGRVFPRVMKASPLLRAWRQRLEAGGADIRTRWRWIGVDAGGFRFETPAGLATLRPRATVLALGGASWPRLGSDAAWAEIFAGEGVRLAPFRPSNVGFGVAWSPHIARHFGAAVKPVALAAGPARSRGEVILTARGVEGGGIYALAHLLRDGAPLTLDLLPDRTPGDIALRLDRDRGRQSLTNHLRRTLGLSPAKIALLREWAPGTRDAAGISRALKALSAPLTGPFPLAEAISTAGGVARDELDDDLMLRRLPGVFCAGEMIDWDAPTGGYLLTACLATGRRAGIAAARLLRLMPGG